MNKRKTQVYCYGSMRNLSRKGAAKYLRDMRVEMRAGRGNVMKKDESYGARTYWFSPSL